MKADLNSLMPGYKIVEKSQYKEIGMKTLKLDNFGFRVLNFILHSNLYHIVLIGNINREEEIKLLSINNKQEYASFFELLEIDFSNLLTIIQQRNIHETIIFMNCLIAEINKNILLQSDFLNIPNYNEKSKFEDNFNKFLMKFLKNFKQNFSVKYSEREKELDNSDSKVRSIIELDHKNYYKFNQEFYYLHHLKYLRVASFEDFCLKFDLDYVNNSNYPILAFFK